ncbi:hypothetical protein L3Y34_019387 [Caenorhabditis briggsae]|uniref:Uncharacterized protein n=1 Tax=Caenorhabditis briggsae TaxID=6238 RepID=A0AAE9IWM4_CAEBR|nr:hypothetical protein L3Y34_019387 [Caenorhabditis briggsae]
MIKRLASECSAGPQSLVQIIMSNQNMPTNPNMITATLVSPLALINIAKSNSQYLNEVNYQNIDDVIEIYIFQVLGRRKAKRRKATYEMRKPHGRR